MKLKSITIEGMHNVPEKTYHFDDVNYLYGDNGAGKSTALMAIQIALLGYVPGQNKRKEAIFQHAKNKAMTVTAIVDDNGRDVKIERAFVGTGSSVTSSTTITPDTYKLESMIGDLELPVYNFSEFKGMTANSLKDWFIQFLPSAGDDVNWKKTLEEELGQMKLIDTELVSTMLDKISEIDASGVDEVRAVNAMFKDELSFLKGEQKRIQSTVQELIFYEDTEDIDIEAAREEIKKIESLREELRQYNMIVQSNEATKKSLEALQTECPSESAEKDKRFVAAKKSYESNQANIIKFSTVDAELRGKVMELRGKVAGCADIIKGGGVCPYTKSACDSIKTMIESMQTDVDAWNKEISELDARIKENAAELFKANEECNSANVTMSNIQTNYSRKLAVEAQMKPEPAIPTSKTDAELQAEVSALYDKIVKAEANKKYSELSENLTAEKYKIENTMEALNMWIKLTGPNKLQSTMMLKPFEALAEEMNTYLSAMFGNPDIKCKFNISEKANSFSFGVEKDDKYISYELLSSGEKCLYTIALMMCISGRSASPLKLIIIDDMIDHLDDKNAEFLFESLTNMESEVQIIMAGVKACTFDGCDDIIIEVK